MTTDSTSQTISPRKPIAWDRVFIVSKRVAVYCTLAVVALILAWGVATLVARLLARAGRDPMVAWHQMNSPAKASTLVIMAHGYRNGVEDLKDLVAAVTEEYGDEAEIQVADYPSHLLSNAAPEKIAAEINDGINQLWTREGSKFREIVLVGHSGGALLLRKAFMFGSGQLDDHPYASTTSAEPRSWALAPAKFVLLAGINGGWKLNEHAGWWSRLTYGAGLWFGRATGTGKLIRSLEGGSPFVADLRVQWLRSHRSATRWSIKAAQIVGVSDDAVTLADSDDMEVTCDFATATVLATGHADIIKFPDNAVGNARKKLFRDALSGRYGKEFLSAEKRSERVVKPDVTVTDVVFICHGIRDWGYWTADIAKELTTAFAAAHQNDDRKLVVIRSGYGYFPMLPFLLLEDRERNVRWFMNEYTHALAQYPRADMEGRHPSFIGHSNGTYLLARALMTYRTVRVGNVVFAGSVVPTSFDWNLYTGPDTSGEPRVAAIKNYVATTDWVVALFPKLFETLGVSDLGSAGFDGFTSRAAKPHQVEFVDGTHSAAIVPTNYPSITSFIVKGVDEPPAPFSNTQNGKLKTLSAVCWLVWGLLSVFLFALICLSWMLGAWLATKMHFKHRAPLGALGAVTCTGLVLAFLCTF